MMKTHTLATVTLGMKNLIGLYPGTVYQTVRAGVHDHAADAGSPGVAFEILDMVRANKLGLVVIDGSTAMEGNGPSDGVLVADECHHRWHQPTGDGYGRRQRHGV